MLTYLFSGQGSQSKGMGAELFAEFPELVAQADELLGYSVRELCLEDKYSNLNQTQFTQPALFIVNALSYLQRLRETGKKPDFVAGHSLGEYNALFAAEVFDFSTGLRMVKKRGELMSSANNGGMAAVIGLGEEQLTAVLQEHKLSDISIANYNSPTQLVIADLKPDLAYVKEVLEKITEVQMFVTLKTSGAFQNVPYRVDTKKSLSYRVFIYIIRKNENGGS